MSAGCVCPDLAPIHAIPTGPVTCSCCGEPLELTCSGACGKRHVRASIRAAAKAVRLPAPARKVAAEHFCARCHRELPRKKGRPRKICDDCLTPSERMDLELKRTYNATRAARAKQVAAEDGR